MNPPPNPLSGERLPPSPKQERSLSKQERLHAVSLALFGERGYRRTSIEEIARRAGFAVGGFYRHYESKRQLLLSLMADLLVKLESLTLELGPSSDPRAALRELLSAAFRDDLEYLGAYRAWQEAVSADAALGRKDAEIRAWTVGRVKGILDQLQQMPGSRPAVDCAALARVLDTLFWALLSQAMHLGAAELSDRLDATTHLVYHAMFTDQRSACGTDSGDVAISS